MVEMVENLENLVYIHHKPFDEFSINSISLQSDGIKIESQAIEVFIKDCNRH